MYDPAQLTDFRIILVEPAFEESIGYVARAMKNFGISNLSLVNPVARLGVSGRMRGGHAQDILGSLSVEASLRDALSGVSLAVGTTAQNAASPVNILRRPLTVRELGVALKNHTGTVGVVFGREGTGLTNVELGQCDTIATIPASDKYQTLNLSHAAAIVFYELFAATSKDRGELLASEDVKKTILSYFSTSAISAGLEEYKVGLTMRALRNVMGRSAIRRREASLLAGAFRQISDIVSPTSPSD